MSYTFYNCYIDSCDKWGRYKILFNDASINTKNIITMLREDSDTRKLPIYDSFFYAKPGKMILEKKEFLEKKYADIDFTISPWVFKEKSGRHFIMKGIKNIH